MLKCVSWKGLEMMENQFEKGGKLGQQNELDQLLKVKSVHQM